MDKIFEKTFRLHVKSELVQQLLSKLHILFYIINNNVLVHLWQKNNLAKYQNSQNIKKHNCLHNFLLLFVALQTSSNFKILAENHFVFLKKQTTANLNVF